MLLYLCTIICKYDAPNKEAHSVVNIRPFLDRNPVKDQIAPPLKRGVWRSRFPEVRRDLAVIVDQEITVADLQIKALEVTDETLIKLKVFDVYIGKGIDSHRKSVALGLTFQHLSRTLTDCEINTSVDKVVDALKVAFNAELR